MILDELKVSIGWATDDQLVAKHTTNSNTYSAHNKVCTLIYPLVSQQLGRSSGLLVLSHFIAPHYPTPRRQTPPVRFILHQRIRSTSCNSDLLECYGAR